MKPRLISALLLVLFTTACTGTFEVGLEHAPTQPVLDLPSFTPAPLQGDTATLQPSPTLPAPTDTFAPVLVHTINIYLIAVDDNGQGGSPVGCGDSLIPVQVEVQPTQAVLKAALQAMLAVKDQYYGQSGLYNALYQADLQVDSVSITDGHATVNLSGTLTLGGECDNPRVQAQLEQTVLQFPTISQADIYLNGRLLQDVLSLKG